MTGFEHLDAPWCASVALVLLHFLWQGAIAAAMGVAAARLLARTPSRRYATYLVTLAGMTLAPVATLWVVWPAPAAAPRLAAAASAPAPAMLTVSPALAPSPIAIAAPVGQPQPAAAAQMASSSPIPSAAAGDTQAPTSLPQHWRALAPPVVTAYLIGVALMLVRLLLGFRGARSLRRSAMLIQDRPLLDRLQALSRRLGLGSGPAIAASVHVTIPIVVGFVRPAILLPAFLLTGLGPDQIEAVLAHELAHVRRWDHLVNLLQRVIEALLFFHPAVWLISGRMRIEREHCCDDLAAGAGDRKTYAHSLVRSAELCCAARCPSPVALAAVGRVSSLRRRIARLLEGDDQPQVHLTRVWPAAALAAAAAVILGVLLHHAPARADERPNPKVDAAIARLRTENVFDDSNEWVTNVRDLESAGRDAVPALSREVRTAKRGFVQCAAAIALRCIGDRRAVPALIAALERCQVSTSSYGFFIPDPEIGHYFRPRSFRPRTLDARYAEFSLALPKDEITASLEQLTGHSEGHAHYSWFQDNGDYPTDSGTDQDERERMLDRAIAARWRAWWEMNKAKLLNAEDLAWTDEFERTSKDELGENPVSLELHAVVEDGSPAGGASVEVWAGRFHETTRLDDGGSVELTFPRSDSTSIIVRAARCVPTRLWYGPKQTLPETFTLTLQPGHSIGGTIFDAANAPVSGARVFTVACPPLALHQWAELADRVATTAADGTWRLDGFPEGFRGAFCVQHPSFVKDQILGKTATAENYARFTETWHLTPVFAVRGSVVDPAGHPVAKARLFIHGGTNYEEPLGPVSTNAAGEFVLLGVAARPATIAVQAAGLSPAWVRLSVNANTPAQTIALVAPRKVHGRVVNASGQPVSDAIVSVGARNELQMVDFDTKTAADGTFEWADAPLDPFELIGYRSGYDIGHASAKVGDSDVTMVLQPVLEVSGKVVDARTNEPIKAFSVVEGWFWGDPPQRGLYRTLTKRFTEGAFDLKFYKPQGSDHRPVRRFLRVEADGHLPQWSPAFDDGQGMRAMDFALEPAEPIRGTVVTVDGPPVAGAQVAVATPSCVADMYGGEVRPGSDNTLFVKTDPEGRFVIPPQTEKYQLIVSHESGWARATQAEVEKNATLVLAPWCRIEGTVTVGRKPVRKADMDLNDPQFDHTPYGEPRVQLFSNVHADADGHYVFPHVYPGDYRLSGESHQHGTMFTSGSGVPVHAEAGKTIRIDFGTPGHRTLVGRFTLDRSQGVRLDLATLDLRVTSAPWTEDSEASPTTAPAPQHVIVRGDGTFRVESVPSGVCTLQVNTTARAGDNDPDRRGFTGGATAGLEVPGGAGSEPIDLGDIPLQLHRSALGVGQPAPAFELTTVDGTPEKLAKLRGKFVLLDFWATWCGPCIAETPNLKSVYDTFGKDPRLAMIGLSLDFDAGSIRKWAAEKGIAWPQVHLQGMWDNRVVADYGVDSIPSIFLIGPDGRVVARDLRGPAIKAAVKKALAEAPK